MGGSQKSKRVTWACDVNLRQVRLFLSEESPSQVGTGIQDHLQAKAFWLGQSGGTESDDNLPPGFEEIRPANPWAAKLSQIPFAKWKIPPRFGVNSNWQVVAGEESRETEPQNQREIGVLQAIYPRPSAIPANPSVSTDVEDTSINEQFIPVVPITAVEDEDAVDIPQPQTFPSQSSVTIYHLTNGISAAGVEPDVAEAAQAALTSVMSKGKHGSNLIDPNFLIKILSDPKMMGQLIANHATAASSTPQNLPPSSILPMPPPSSTFHTVPAIGSSTTPHMPAAGVRHSPFPTTPSILCPPSTSTPYGPNIGINRRDPISAPIPRPELSGPPRPTVSGPFYPPTSPGTIPSIRASAPDSISALSPSMATGPAPVSKDINYYKSLIQLHGSTQPLPGMSHEPLGIIKPREPKPKMLKKPCIYFNTPRGCRNGANCTFLHDNTIATASRQRVCNSPEVQSTKRVKLDA